MRIKGIYVGKDKNGNLIKVGDGLKNNEGVFLGYVVLYSSGEYRIKSVTSIFDLRLDLKNSILISQKEKEEQIFNQFRFLLEDVVYSLEKLKQLNPNEALWFIMNILDSKLKPLLLQEAHSIKSVTVIQKLKNTLYNLIRKKLQEKNI